VSCRIAQYTLSLSLDLATHKSSPFARGSMCDGWKERIQDSRVWSVSDAMAKAARGAALQPPQSQG
jgi:hypothetical protein